MIDLSPLTLRYRTVFDVGGNGGAFAAAAHRRWPQASIYSFEPIMEIANDNARFAAGRWTVIPVGLADTIGARMINRNLRSSGASTLLKPGPVRRDAFGADDEYVPERALFGTLDEYTQLVESPALLKIDVEGAELLVLKGGPRTVPLFDTVVVEVNDCPDCFLGAPPPEEVDTLMDALGFEATAVAGELRDPRDGTLLQYDAVWERR